MLFIEADQYCSPKNVTKAMVHIIYYTKAEREDCKALVEVARQRTENESGDWIHRVRGPPGHMVIVRMRKV